MKASQTIYLKHPGTILSTGILAGTLDATAASIHYFLKVGKSPVNIFKFIASGVFGEVAQKGGGGMAVLGLLFHFAIAMTWTVLFFFLYPRIAFLRKSRLGAAIVYGCFVWVVMTRIVLPLSKIPAMPFKIDQAAIGIGILILAIGLPLSIGAHRYYSQNPRR